MESQASSGFAGVAPLYSMKYYILKDKIAVPTKSLLEWGESFQNKDRIVGKTIINGFRISTVFLGLDHNFIGKGPPLLFETMVFPPDDWNDLEMVRYSTWAEAEIGHMVMCDIVKEWSDKADLTVEEMCKRIRSSL